MRYPLKMTANLAKYIATPAACVARKNFRLVMMLEPLHACNPHVHGMRTNPRIQIHHQRNNDGGAVPYRLPMSAARRPFVSICGGEPMIYPEIGRLAKEISGAWSAYYFCAPTECFIRKRPA